jgi:hypothetical protein
MVILIRPSSIIDKLRIVLIKVAGLKLKITYQAFILAISSPKLFLLAAINNTLRSIPGNHPINTIRGVADVLNDDIHVILLL